MIARRLTAWLLVLAAVLGACVPVRAATVLLVIDGSSPTVTESGIVSQLQSWGYTVTTIQDSASQASFDAAVATAHVAYVPLSVTGWELGYKLRTAPIGVISEEIILDNEFGFATGDGWTSSITQIDVLSNTHQITSGMSTGLVTMVTSSQPLAMSNGTVAAGMVILAKQSTTNMMLGYIEKGGALADTYSGNSTASGRRVRFPWGGDAFNLSALNTTAQSMAQRAFAWASTTPALVGQWRLNQTSGTTASDSSTTANNGTYTNGPTLNVAGPYAGKGKIAAQFDGTNDYVTIPDNSKYSNHATDALTVSAWVKVIAFATDGSSAVRAPIVAKGTTNAYEWSLYAYDNGDVGASFWQQAGSSHSEISGGKLTAGKWAHVLMTFQKGVANKLYVNGQLVATGTSFTGNPYDGTRPVQIGRREDGEYLNAVIQDVRIYNYALTASQVAEVHGLLAHWKLNETTGTTADDSSIANNDATLTGTQGWQYAIDDYGHNFVYSGGEDYFVAPSNTALDNVQEDDYTIMAYFKPNSLPPGTGSANNANYGIIRKEGWHAGLLYSSTGEFYTEHWVTGPTWQGTGTWGTAYAPGRYYHVAAVVNRTDGNIKIYVDGELKNTATFTAGTAAYEYGTSRWRLGVSSPGASTYGHAADGVIDDARIYNRALSDSEIAEFVNPGLQGHWKLDETSGTTLTDSSGRERHAAFDTGTPTRVAAVRDNGLSFSGSNDADTDASFDPPAAGTVAFWLKPNDVASSSTHVLGTSSSWRVRRTNSGYLRFDLGANPGVTTTDTFNNTSRWRHVVATYNSISDTYAVYIDGALAQSGALTMTDQAGAVLAFGTHTGSTSRLNGQLDDIRIYSYEISAAQVAELYGLMGHWKFNEGTGTSLADSSGAGNSAVFFTGTPAWVDGPRVKALEFDGTNDTQTAGNFTPPAEGTLAFWIRSPSQPATNRRFLGLGGDFEARVYPDGMIYFDICGDSPSGALTVLPITHNDQWQHVVHVYDSDDDSFATYLNGQLSSSGIATVNRVQQAAAKLSFGTRTGTTERFVGGLDDVRIYNRKLSASEVAEIYGLVGHYKLDETSGTVAADSSGLGNNGTYIGSPTLGAASTGRASLNTAVEFNGSNYVEIPSLLAGTQSVTLTGWAFLDAKDTSGAELVTIGDCFMLRLDNFGGWTTASFYNGSGWTNVDDAGTVASTGWHHFAAVLREGQTYKLFIDGVEQANMAISWANSYSGQGSTTRIGKHGNTSTAYDFDGKIDDVRVYNRGLLPQEIDTIYQGGKPQGIRIIKWVEMQ